MLKNYLKVAVRHLFRQPLYAFLNILGLTIGLVASLLILLYLSNELSYDAYHEKADRIYRVSADIAEPDNAFRWAVTQMPLAKELKAQFGEVEEYVRFIGSGRTRFEREEQDNSFYEEEIYFVDSTLFDVFTFNLIKGEKATALKEPNTIVISESVSNRIFGDENPIGQVLRTDNLTLTVTGVYEDQPLNSHIIADGMISASSNPGTNNTNWGGFGIYSYVLLREDADPVAFEEKLQGIIDQHVNPIFEPIGITIKYETINIADIHLTSTFEGEPQPRGNMEYIYIFSIIGVFLLLIACINYMNMATARSVDRSLEVGMRKVLGAYRQSLVGQFLTESFLISLIAAALSLLLLYMTVPAVNALFDLHLSLEALWQPQLFVVFLLIVFFTGILGGSYPAFFLSSIQPIIALKGGSRTKGGNKNLRRVLVVVQFMISMFMFVGTAVIYQQMEYVQNKDLGFDKEQVMRFNMPTREMREKWPVLREKLIQSTNISNAATSSSAPGYGFGKQVMLIEKKDGTLDPKGVDNYRVDFDFFETLKMEIIEGRNISSEYATDSTEAVLVNEAMVRRMGWENPIGKKFQTQGSDTLPFHKVVGVVRDFHQRSLYDPIEALLFIPNFNNGRAFVKISGEIDEGITYAQQSWEATFPNLPFEYEFVDENFQEQYETDQQRGQLCLGFSILTIIIACLGLLGLASFTATQRAKEISIRKVLGTDVTGLVSLLVKDFIILVVIAAAPAFAAAYFFMADWLTIFEYHMQLGVGLFALVLVLTLVVTVLTTSYHAYRAAVANPIENLKYE